MSIATGYLRVGLRYSRVSAIETVRMNGAARITTGSITIHAISHDDIQCLRNSTIVAAGKLAMNAAIRLVNPDWRVPKTKWLCLRAILTIRASPLFQNQARDVPRVPVKAQRNPESEVRSRGALAPEANFLLRCAETDVPARRTEMPENCGCDSQRLFRADARQLSRQSATGISLLQHDAV
jgi:hypothetical protein